MAEVLVIAEAVTGIDVHTLSRASRVDLLDSALHAPQAGFDSATRTSIRRSSTRPRLVVRIPRNHPLPDGNKRLAWQALTVFLALNGHRLDLAADDAVKMMLAIAAGDNDEEAVAAWLRARVEPPLPDDK
ncbi:MAG: type II toxin-antitoxin system death-on-curing family toxin [Actinobacteria bacterium]|nr:type II toxin-antitoxin system death-on-curing family toxin [Actinomycetota bacterium]